MWKLVHNEGPIEWGGRISVFVDVLDEQGKRLVGVPVTFKWKDGIQTKLTEAKPGDDFAVDFPMYAAGDAYSVFVNDGTPSVVREHMGLGAVHPVHVVYKLVFQRTDEIPDIDSGPPSPPTVPSGDKIQFIVNGITIYSN